MSAGEAGAGLLLCGNPGVLPDTGAMRWWRSFRGPMTARFTHCHGKGAGASSARDAQ